MSRALVLTGGPDHAHDFGASGAALAGLVAGAGFTVEVADHPDGAAARLAAGGIEVLAMNALRWRMLPERYAPWRRAWAYHTPPATRAALDAFVAGGGGLIASHTASICFDDWPEWADVLGGAWDWDRSSHPPPAEVDVHVVAPHPVTDGLPERFTLVDEVYGDQRVRPDAEVLAVARRSPDDADQPVVWAYRHGRGRVVYDGFGHDAASLTHPVHARLLHQALAWVAGGGEAA